MVTMMIGTGRMMMTITKALKDRMTATEIGQARVAARELNGAADALATAQDDVDSAGSCCGVSMATARQITKLERAEARYNKIKCRLFRAIMVAAGYSGRTGQSGRGRIE